MCANVLSVRSCFADKMFWRHVPWRLFSNCFPRRSHATLDLVPRSLPGKAPGGAVADIESLAPQGPDDKERPHSRWQYLRSLAWVRPALCLLALYCLGLVVVVMVFRRLPSLANLADLAAREQQASGSQAAGDSELQLKVPHSFEELRAIRDTLERYRRAYSLQLATLLVAAYLFLQTFMIPGPLAISVLVGSLYPFSTAMAFMVAVSTVGASLNFLLIKLLAKDVITALFPARVAAFQHQLKRHRQHLLNYMLFVRVTPVLPHWFVNVASPIVGVPFRVYIFATSVGYLPMAVITVQAGAALKTMRSMSDLYSAKNVLVLMAAGAVALVPVLWKWRRAVAVVSRGPTLAVIDSSHVS